MAQRVGISFVHLSFLLCCSLPGAGGRARRRRREIFSQFCFWERGEYAAKVDIMLLQKKIKREDE